MMFYLAHYVSQVLSLQYVINIEITNRVLKKFFST